MSTPAERSQCESWPPGTTGQPEDLTAPHFDSSALLVIDVQVDFLDEGAWTIAGTSDRLARIAALAAAYRSVARPIVHVVRPYDGDDVDLVRRTALREGAQMVRPGSPGAQIAPQLLPRGVAEGDDGLVGARPFTSGASCCHRPNQHPADAACLTAAQVQHRCSRP